MESVLHKIEEEGKSRKSHAEENPSPVDCAGSKLAGCKHNKEEQMIQSPMEPSLKSICFTPSEYSSDDPLSGKTDDLDHHLQVQNAGKKKQDDDDDDDYSYSTGIWSDDSDDDFKFGSKDIHKYIDRELAKEFQQYKKQVEASKGFDVDYFPRFHTTMFGGITPVGPRKIKRYGEDYKHFMEIAAAKAYKICGCQEFKDLQMVKANIQCWGVAVHHFITFTAKGFSDGKTRLFQSKVTRVYDYKSVSYDDEDIIPNDTVQSLWLKDDQGQVTNCISE